MRYEIINNNKYNLRLIEAEVRLRNAMDRFGRINISSLNTGLNNKREQTLISWKKKKYAKMIDEGLPNMTYLQGIQEISDSFNLREQKVIKIILIENGKSYVNNGLSAMEINTGDNLNPIINVYMDCFDKEFIWNNERIENILFHELLHAFGDTKNDGIIRHNLIGVKSIIEILDQTGR